MLSEETPLLRPTSGDVELGTTKDVILDFDPNGDKDNPKEWPSAFKWAIVLLLFSMAATVSFTCISVVPIANEIISDLDDGQPGFSGASALMVTIWEFGESAGPLFIAPLSEVYGRYAVINGANILFICAALLAAVATSTPLFIASRALNGLAVAANVLNPAIIGDMFDSDERGAAMSAVMLAPLLGGAIGPTFSGAVTETLGWRAVLLIAAGLALCCELLFLTCFQETYKMTILRRRAAKLSGGETGVDILAKTPSDIAQEQTGLSKMWHAVSRPAAILFDSGVLSSIALFGAVPFSYFYVVSVSMPTILHDVYGFSPSQTGLAFISMSVGACVAVTICNLTLDRIYIHLRGSDKAQPEYRLPLATYGGLCLPFIVTAYGWIAEYQLPVWLLLTTTGLLNGAVIIIIIPLSAYVVDTCGIYAASAMTGLIVSRGVMGTFLPLGTGPIIESLGYGWDIHMGNALLYVPELEVLSPKRTIEYLGPPQVGKVERRDGAPLEPGVPEYLVEPVEYSTAIHPDLREIKLVDFGESFFSAEPPTQIYTPMSLHPPELVFQRGLSSSVDIWNLGCTTYELVTGRTILDADFNNDLALIPQFKKVVGGLPEQWIQDALDRGVLKESPDDSSAEDFDTLEGELRRSYFEGYKAETLQLSQGEIDTLGRYLRRMLVIDPERRATARELLQDPWVLELERGDDEA
ncbi:related to multidrug resistance protein [Cephalotrichum gorgonifer]|uniref:Related to multidrug resistance protein n=1 Tax=Cephalotrichum gorgonifer TaxID=2041049 RepID=A0AAE8MXZ4_9PEZI|nr:related to multidrug resistance protein [Cephalotrichum gorgonifer]